MKKSDLRTGMIVEYRNGCKRIVLIGTPCGDILKGFQDNSISNMWLGMCDFTEDLTNSSIRDFDITKVYSCDFPNQIGLFDEYKLVWQRKELKEVTMQEIEEKFGCPVKIIKE